MVDRLMEAEAEITRLHQERERWIDYKTDLQRIIEALCDRRGLPEPVSTARHHYNMAREHLAADRLAGARVKPLEWEDADEGMCTKWRAAALGGHYELVALDGDDGGLAVNFHWGRPLSFWFIQGEPDERGPTGPKMFPTLEDAKSAAQADYERRILAALAEPAGESEQQEPLCWLPTQTVKWLQEYDGPACGQKTVAHNRPIKSDGGVPLYTTPPDASAIRGDHIKDAARILYDGYDHMGSLPRAAYDYAYSGHFFSALRVLFDDDFAGANP